MKKPCISHNCPGYSFSSSPRCVAHEREYQRRRNAKPTRKAYSDPNYKAFPLAGGKCVDCGATEDLTRDHRIPLSKDGSNDWSNLEIRCRSCNSSKRDKETQ